jgi:chromosome segregation ATPase
MHEHLGKHVQIYHDLTAFWLGEGKQLRDKLAQLKSNYQQFLEAHNAIRAENAELKQRCTVLEKALAAERSESSHLSTQLSLERQAFEKVLDSDTLTRKQIEAIMERLWSVWRKKLDESAQREMERLRG